MRYENIRRPQGRRVRQVLAKFSYDRHERLSGYLFADYATDIEQDIIRKMGLSERLLEDRG